MANVNAPSGLKPVRHINGAPYNGAANVYFVPASDSTAIYIGSLVKFAGSADANGVATVTGNVATGNSMVGVMVGAVPVTNASPTYREASVDRYIMVADNPSLIFEVQEDAIGGALAVGDVGNVAEFIGFTGGSTATGLSSMQLDTSTKVASGGAAKDALIFGFVQRADNEVGNANAKVLVRLNNHALVNAFVGA
jgi:hypothetical protein